MTLIFACICRKDGSIVVGRNYFDIPKSRVEGLVGEFCRLISGGSSNSGGIIDDSSRNASFGSSFGSRDGQQHTFVEGSSVRFLFRPLDSFGYLLLATDKLSDILGDLHCLQVCSCVIMESCSCSSSVASGSTLNSAATLTPQEAQEANWNSIKFEILFAFDEVALQGHSPASNLSASQLGKILQMDSQEEAIQNAINERKEKEAKEHAKLKIKQIEHQKREAAKRAAKGADSKSFMQQQHNSLMNGGSGSIAATRLKPQETVHVSLERASGGGNHSESAFQAAALGSGMKLGKGMKVGKNAFSADVAAIQQEEKGIFQPLKANAAASIHHHGSRDANSINVGNISQEQPVAIEISELICASLSQASGVQNFEVKGMLALCIVDEDYASISIEIRQPTHLGKAFQLRPHPNIDKERLSPVAATSGEGKETTGMIAMKERGKPFPCHQNLGLLKWKYSSSSDSLLPLLVTCWPSLRKSDSHGEIEVSLEYEVPNAQALPIIGTLVQIPCSETFHVVGIDGEYEFNRQESTLDWSIPRIDERNSTGSFSFVAKGISSVDEIFPIEISFALQRSVIGMEVGKVMKCCQEGGVLEDDDCPCERKISVKTERYFIDDNTNND